MRNLGKHLGKAIREGRLAHPRKYSQNELGALLNLNGQVLSNLERGNNSLHVRHVIQLSKILEIPFERLKRAMIQDFEDALTAEVFSVLDKGVSPPNYARLDFCRT